MKNGTRIERDCPHCKLGQLVILQGAVFCEDCHEQVLSRHDTMRNGSMICAVTGFRRSVFSCEKDAMLQLDRYGLSQKTIDQHYAFLCPGCRMYHLEKKGF